MATEVQKLSSGCTRAQRCLGILCSNDGKQVYEAQGDCVVVRSTKTGEVLHRLRATTPPIDLNTNEIGEVYRLRYRKRAIRSHFESKYKNPNADEMDPEVLEAHRASWIKRQVDKFTISPDHLSHVTSTALHPTQSNQLFVATADHLLRIWDISQGTILETFTLDAPAVWLGASTVDPSLLLIVLNETPKLDRIHAQIMRKRERTKSKDLLTRKSTIVMNLHGLETTHWRLISFNWTKGVTESNIFDQRYYPFYGAQIQQRSLQSDYINAIAIIANSDLVYIRIGVKNTGDVTERPVDIVKHKHGRPFSCVTIHPTLDDVVTGDVIGQMQVWRHLNTNKHVQPSKLHWHAHRVGCVAYSRDGTYVASGGEEYVLVLWHLESGRRQYVPRLSAALTGIATNGDGSGYLVACQDNSILTFNPVTNSQGWQKGGLGRVGLSATKTLISRQLPVDPWSNTIVVQGKSQVGHIQFYNPLQDRVVSTLALTQRNQISRMEDEAPIRTFATQICFSTSARTMATVATTLEECVLRFWTRKSDGTYSMHTDIDMPHGDHTITSMCAQGNYFVTGDNIGEFRLWHNPTGGSWTCRSVAQFREIPIQSTSFSPDGSLLAISYGSLLTLWDPVTNVLKSVLSYPKTDIKEILFAPNTPHVIVRTECGIYVWSLLTCTVAWFYTLPIDTMAISTTGQLVLTKITKPKSLHVNTHVILFDITSPYPTAIYRIPGIGIESVVYYKNQLIGMDHISHIYAIGNEMKYPIDPSSYTPETTSILKQMYGHLKVQEKEIKKNENSMNEKKNDTIFQAPSHVLPPLRSLYRTFLDTMLKGKEDIDIISSTTTNKQFKFEKNEENPKKKQKIIQEYEKPEKTYESLKKIFSNN